MSAVCNKIKSIVAFAVICVILSLPLDAFASGDSDFVYYIRNGKVCGRFRAGRPCGVF